MLFPMKSIHYSLFFLFSSLVFSQTKISGYVHDEYNEPIAFANIIFSGTSEGTTSDENGKFYLESEKQLKQLRVSFVGYKSLTVQLDKAVNFNVKYVLQEDVAQLSQVLVVSGKQPKKNNPAVDILKKIWLNKRKNGLKQFKQYQYNKYEKVEFDMNTIDSALIKSKLFRGMEFVFDQMDTSSVTGKTYLPIFINESLSKVYGDNVLNKEKEVLKGNKNSGFNNDQFIIDFVDDLYNEFSIYDNYLKFFDKSFVSPLSRTGINNYNYVLSDSTYIDDKWCYNIIYYPRRKNELTFKGDFWVNDTTYAIKKINLQASKSANINWVKDIYIEQEYELLNDSLFLITRDYMLSDFALNKKDKSKGIYGKRTSLYDKYKFNIPQKSAKFYDEEVYNYNEDVYNRDETFWEENRLEKLNKDEKGVYKMLDTLRTVKKFKRLFNIGTILASGYIEVPSLKMDIGPLFSTVGFNEVEGYRLRLGGRTYFGPNDLWRIEGFTAYGFDDKKFKYGISGKWLLDKKRRLIISGGHRKDVEQIGASLTSSTDVLGRNLASSSIVNTSANDKLTTINLSGLSVAIEPFKNFILRLGSTFKTLESASPTFSLDYNDPEGLNVLSEVNQYETSFGMFYFPGRKTTGFGVDRRNANDNFSRLFAQVSQGTEGILGSDFEYTKVQFSYIQPWQLGGFGRLTTSVEAGKTFGEVPLALLNVVPGNQTLFSIYNTFSQLDFYEFVTDTYTSVHLEHNFNGRLFSRIPLLRKLNLREIISVKGVWGQLSDQNIALNTTGNPNSILLQAPDDQIYWEYGLGIGNIFKVFRLDFNFRGNYLDTPNARRFGITGSFGFNF